MPEFNDSDRQLLKEVHGTVIRLESVVSRMRLEVDAHDSRLDTLAQKFAAMSAVDKYKTFRSEFSLKEAAFLVALGSTILGALTSIIKLH